MPRVANLIATGRHLPERRVDNRDLARHFAGLGDPGVIDKLEARSGILQRWWAPDDWATSDLALPAARQALERAGRRPEEVDLLIVGTDSPDYITPATATVLQAKLGARRAGTFDIGCACASFPTGLAVAAGLMAALDSMRTVLVVGVYLMHRLADSDDPMIFFYGDGAGAAVLEAGDASGFVGAAMHANGDYAEYWGLYAGATAEPASVEAVQAGRTQVRVNGRYPAAINEQGWPQLFQRLLDEQGLTVAEVDHAIFTQVNRATIEATCERLGLPREKAAIIMDRWGYTGSACVPMALDDLAERGKLRIGDLVVMIGSGVGYNQAAAAFRITDRLARP